MPSLASSSFLHISGKILGIFFGLGTFYVLLHTFGTDGFGVFTTALTYVTFFAVIVDFGLTITTTQMISEKGADEKRILANLLSLRLGSALVFMALAPLSAWLIPGMDTLFPLIAIASATYFFGSVAQMFLGVFQKRLSLFTPVVAELISRGIALLGVVLVAATTHSLAHATLAFTLGTLVQLIIMLVVTHKRIPLSLAFDRGVWKDIVVRSWPIGLSIFFNLIYLKGDILLLWAFGQSDATIGQYASAYKIVDILTMIPVTFMGLVLPLLTHAWSAGDTDAFTKRMQQTVDIFALIAIPVMFGAWAIGIPLMEAIKGDLTLAGQLLWVLVPASAVVFFGSLFGHAVVAVQAQRPMTKYYLFGALLGVVGYATLIPLFGVWGAGSITLLCEAFIAVAAYRMVRTKWQGRISYALPRRAFWASVVMFAALIALRTLPISLAPILFLLVALSIAGITYTLVLGKLGGPTPQDLRRLFASEHTPHIL